LSAARSSPGHPLPTTSGTKVWSAESPAGPTQRPQPLRTHSRAGATASALPLRSGRGSGVGSHSRRWHLPVLAVHHAPPAPGQRGIEGTSAPAHPPGQEEARAHGHPAEPGVVLGHHQTPTEASTTTSTSSSTSSAATSSAGCWPPPSQPSWPPTSSTMPSSPRGWTGTNSPSTPTGGHPCAPSRCPS
jgi:hypothetical protein